MQDKEKRLRGGKNDTEEVEIAGNARQTASERQSQTTAMSGNRDETIKLSKETMD